MKCVCTTACFIEHPTLGVPTRFNPGQVEDFEKCPTHFKALNVSGNLEIDFKNASEEELMAVQWSFSDAEAAVKEAYNVELTREEGTTKADVVKQIVEARTRHIDLSTKAPKAQ